MRNKITAVMMAAILGVSAFPLNSGAAHSRDFSHELAASLNLLFQ